MAPGNQSRVKQDATGQQIKPGRPLNEDDRQGLERMRPYEAFVWSSAQPENVWSMVERAFENHADLIHPQEDKRRHAAREIRNVPLGDRPGRLLGVWDRKSLGLSSADFSKKSRTSKDLRKILDAFAKTVDAPAAPDPCFVPQIFNTLLLDDSIGQEAKSGSQPWNHIPLKPYEIEHKNRDEDFIREYATGKKADLEGFGRRFDDSVPALQADSRARVAVLSAMFGSDALRCYDDIKAGKLTETNIDAALLAVIGILAELSDVMVVPAWIASGGLMPDIESSFTRADAAKGWAEVVASDLSLPALPQGVTRRSEDDGKLWKRNVLVNAQNVPQLSPQKHSAPKVPPSSPAYRHWFDSPLHVLYWVRRGMIALDERGVPINHGIVPGPKILPPRQGQSSPRSSPARQSDRSQDWRATPQAPRADFRDLRREGIPERPRHIRYDHQPGSLQAPRAGPSSAPDRQADYSRAWSDQQVGYQSRTRRERIPSDSYLPDRRREPREQHHRGGPRDDRSKSPVRGRTGSRAYERREVGRGDEPMRSRAESRSEETRSYSPGRSLSLSMSPTSREYSMLYAPTRERSRPRESSVTSERRSVMSDRRRSVSRDRRERRYPSRSRSRRRLTPPHRIRRWSRSRSPERRVFRSRSRSMSRGRWERGRIPSPRKPYDDELELHNAQFRREPGWAERRYSPSNPQHRYSPNSRYSPSSPQNRW